MNIKYCAPCLFGLEGLVADELKLMGFENVAAENGRVLFSGDETGIATANINLRCAERVQILVGEFDAPTFDALFEGVKALPWENFIPKDGQFPVKGHSLNSALHSIPDCQKIVKKAIVSRLGARYHVAWLPETGAKYQIQFSIMKDRASLLIDTSGTGLHKRGYRPAGNAAPLRETLAAAIVKIARYKGRDSFYDPFCGSGTIAIEAALAALNRAPGLNRGFAAESWKQLSASVWKNAREAAAAKEYSGEYDINASDIDPAMEAIVKGNAARAGVDKIVRYRTADASQTVRSLSGGVIMTNPPYGERLLERTDAEKIYRDFGAAMAGREDLKLYLLSSHADFEKFYGKNAKKRRKLYNGMLQCQLYMYF